MIGKGILGFTSDNPICNRCAKTTLIEGDKFMLYFDNSFMNAIMDVINPISNRINAEISFWLVRRIIVLIRDYTCDFNRAKHAKSCFISIDDFSFNFND